MQEIFATVQGEGPRAGEPAVFVRLGGCNLACAFCDTEFESFTTQALEDIIARTGELSEDGRKLVVMTGGEPFRQPIEPLCDALLIAGFTVQIETNGTLYRPLDRRVETVCSPKNMGAGYRRLRGELLARLTALKFIISASNPFYADVGEVGQSEYNIPVFVQPMDECNTEKNAANVARVFLLAQAHDYRISLQLHKLFGIP